MTADTRQDMQIYVKEWPNRAATLYAEIGEELWTFSSLERLERGDIGALRVLMGGRAAA
jgi:hypothetical protein